MTGYLFWAHLWASSCAFALSGFLFAAARSVRFRFALGPSEADRTYNFGVVSLFLFSAGLDLLAAPFGIEELPHTAAVTLACLTGAIAVGKFAWRVTRWKI